MNTLRYDVEWSEDLEAKTLTLRLLTKRARKYMREWYWQNEIEQGHKVTLPLCEFESVFCHLWEFNIADRQGIVERMPEFAR